MSRPVNMRALVDDVGVRFRFEDDDDHACIIVRWDGTWERYDSDADEVDAGGGLAAQRLARAFRCLVEGRDDG